MIAEKRGRRCRRLHEIDQDGNERGKRDLGQRGQEVEKQEQREGGPDRLHEMPIERPERAGRLHDGLAREWIDLLLEPAEHGSPQMVYARCDRTPGQASTANACGPAYLSLPDGCRFTVVRAGSVARGRRAEPGRIRVHAEALEVPADAVQVAGEQLARIAVGARIDRLREVDDPGSAVVDQDVIGRQVGVDHVVGQQPFDVPDEPIEHPAGRAGGKPQLPELRGGALFIAHEFHQDRRARLRHAASARRRLPKWSRQSMSNSWFDPQRLFDLPAEPALVRDGPGGPGVTHEAAVLVGRAVLETAAEPRTEIFHGQQRRPRFRRRPGT